MEILYSTTILSFLRKVKNMAFEILSNEMGIQVGRSRFHYQGYSYPLQCIVFDHPTTLGTFQSDLFEIGINKLFLFEDDKATKEVIRRMEVMSPLMEKNFGKCANGMGGLSKFQEQRLP
jgi:hypothetical protein